MTWEFRIAIALLLSSASPCAPGGEDPLTRWTRQDAPHAREWSFRPSANGAIRVEVRDGDCSDRRRTPECATGRERAELVDPVEPLLGSVVWYGYSLLIPADTPRLPVHITVGQWWSPSLVFALRETNGEVDFTVYTGSTTQRCKIGAALAPRGQWHRLVVRAAYGPGPTREIEAFLGDVQVCRWQGNAENGERLPVWKLGLYRPTIGKVPRPHPTQTVFFRDIRKGPARTDVQ